MVVTHKLDLLQSQFCFSNYDVCNCAGDYWQAESSESSLAEIWTEFRPQFVFCKWTAIRTANPKTHQMFLSHRLQNQVDSDKMLYLLSW